jgi:hypothetical protein
MRKSTHHSRVGARKRAKLKKWSGKATRESRTADIDKRAVAKRRAHDIVASLGAAKNKLRRLFA